MFGISRYTFAFHILLILILCKDNEDDRDVDVLLFQ